MVVPPTEISQLVRRAQKGDSLAITKLYELHAQTIYRYVIYRVPNEDAEDITAEVFVKMVEGLPTYSERGVPFEAWLYRIAAARIADYYRIKSRRPQVELDEQLSSDQLTPEDQLETKQELAVLRDALSKLTEDERTLLIMRFVERRGHVDVAEVLGKSVTAVKSMQHRALLKLSDLLGSKAKVRHYLRGRNEE